jgi:N-acetylneuraminate synthase
MKFSNQFRIGSRWLGEGHPTYFIADIAANHDGNLERALHLIRLAACAGADAVKFQHFQADTIVSDRGFKDLGGQKSHQSSWKRSVVEVYRAASVPVDWTRALREESDKAGVAFFTSPYSMELVDAVAPFVEAFKVGSGDVTWPALIRHMASKGKPVLIAVGASTLGEAADAVKAAATDNPDVALMQCNTNYTGSPDNYRHLHLNVLKSFAATWPGLVLGLSDHTQGIAPILGAVALGAKLVERHFTDDRTRTGPDHAFATDPAGWREMVDRTRELELSLGSHFKQVAENEVETRILQRRALRAAIDLPEGHVLGADDLVPLRPCPVEGIPPCDLDLLVGKRIGTALAKGSHLSWKHLL